MLSSFQPSESVDAGKEHWGRNEDREGRRQGMNDSVILCFGGGGWGGQAEHRGFV